MKARSADRQVAQELLEKLEFLFERYSNELRATTQPYTLQRLQASVGSFAYEPDSPVVRETLMEHIGSLPMLATAVYPYIDDADVDLGRALHMLAIHDIGELITHDEITFARKQPGIDAEQAAALSLLDPSYHNLYLEVEHKVSKTAQFAKSIDKINPDILDYLTPADITITRYKHFLGIGPDEIVGVILKHKRPYMLWNPFMTELHIVLLEKLSQKLKQ